MIAMCKCTVWSILNTEATCIRVMHTHAGLVVAQMVPPLRIPSSAVKKWAFISVGAYAGGLVVFRTIIVRTVVEGAVPLSHRPASPLVHKVPIEARKRPVLGAFTLYKEGTLFDAKFLQVSGMRIHRATHYFVTFLAYEPRGVAVIAFTLQLGTGFSFT